MDKTKDIAKVTLPQQGPPLSPAEIRERTRQTNAETFAAIQAGEARLLEPDYQGYVDDGPVLPGHGADSAYDLAPSGHEGNVETTPEDGLDVNPAQTAKPKGGA